MQAFRPSKIRCYIDETGQFVPRGGLPKVMAAFFFNESAADAVALEATVAGWRERYAGGGRVKANMLSAGASADFARLMKARTWMVASRAVELEPGMDSNIRETMIAEVEASQQRLKGASTLDLRPGLLKQQIREMSAEQVCWYLSLNHLMGTVCGFFEGKGLCPVGTFVMDEKLEMDSPELAGFLLRLSIMTRFPSVFSGSLSLALGVDANDPWFQVRVSTDDREPGLVAADLCAYLYGALARMGPDAPAAAIEFDEILRAPVAVAPR